MQEAIVVADRAADIFVSSFYKVFDRQRHLLPKMYSDWSKLLWNGNAIASDQISNFLLQMPPSNHIIHGYDAQPLVQPARSILVSVSGSVSFGSDDSKSAKNQNLFSQQFILTPDPDPAKNGTYVIGSDTFRFIS